MKKWKFYKMYSVMGIVLTVVVVGATIGSFFMEEPLKTTNSIVMAAYCFIMSQLHLMNDT